MATKTNLTDDDLLKVIKDESYVEAITTWLKQAALEKKADADGDEELAESYFQLRKHLWPKAVKATFIVMTFEECGEGHFVKDANAAVHEMAAELGPIAIEGWTRLCFAAIQTYSW